MAADRGSESESRRHRKSESQSQGSVNGDEIEEPDFSDPEGYVDDISEEGSKSLHCLFCAIWVGSLNLQTRVTIKGAIFGHIMPG